MTTLPSIDALNELLDTYYDPRSLRWTAYAAEDRVQLLSVNPGLITAVCRGSGRNTYVVRIRWLDRVGDIDLHDGCSCPLGGRCKHCVATLVAARRQAGPPATSPSAGEWRRALADLTTDDPGDDRPPTGVALQLVVQHPPRTRYAADTGPRVTIRPLRRGKSGKWIKTGASWHDVESPYSRDLADVDAHQRAALRALMASGRLDHYYGSSQAVPLDTFGPDLWHQLTRAIDVGVKLVGERPDHEVELFGTSARPCVDLTEDETGAVTLTTGFVLDDEPLALVDGGSGLVGRPAHGLWRLRAGARCSSCRSTHRCTPPWNGW